MNTYKLTLVALLASLAVVGRFAFAFLPNIQPVTSLIIIAGLFLGPLAAAIMAILTTFLSNILLGMGIWTVWQVVAWVFIGVISGFIGKSKRKTPTLVIVLYAAFSGYFYGLIISLVTYQVAGKFWPYYLAGLPFDTYHAVGNAMVMLVFYPIVSKFFIKYAQDRFTIQGNQNTKRGTEGQV
ncbi:ECF transporter S component [Oceanobacillus halophilus]|uniref:ECF transporter S component n=1 Tax=Oceanobacillus halophilus TaxID=930130 RepID=A0A494ZUD6_9BACI|nr:ECF transporter S component [Oceanobacillus halophilus]RKQ29243.1 ECF transporter S component [Oceanobacillus halophilus]